jgi:protein TonB
MPQATQTPPSRPDPRAHLAGIPSPLHRESEDLELEPSTEEKEGLAPVGADLREAVPDYAVNPEPVYPRLAIRRNYEGTVLLMVEVLSDGSVREVRVLESSGHAILDRSALNAVQKWRFKPGTRGGKPVIMNVKVPVVFRLTGEEKG